MSVMREMALPLIEDFRSVMELPHTVSFFIRKMGQIMSFDELTKDKRPPEVIWDNSEALENWFDNVFEYRKDKSSSTPEAMSIIIEDIEE